MSERKMKTLSNGDSEPVIAYYQMKKPDVEHPKVRVLKKGDKLAGIYQHTFIDGEYKSHLIRTEEGKVTIKGCTSLNDNFAKTAKGTYVEVTYKGLGPKKAGRKAAYLFQFDVEDTGAGSTSTAPEADADESEDNDEEAEEELVF